MSNISIRRKKAWGFYGHSTIQHEYETKIIDDNKVVIDHATGLMWHPSGSYEYMKRKEIKKWIRGLNSKGYAGYYDWRVPTVEEASSLLEASEKNGNLYIDTAFDKKQRWIWTGDSCSSGGMWRVYFDDGYVDWGDVSFLFVRPVRKTR
ncbi:MAG: Lcl C-terminal domain-containing protein [Planctomycetota bacterium]